MTKIALGFFGIILTLLFALFLAGGFDTVEMEADLRVCWGSEPESLDPALVQGVLESRYVYSLFEGLATYDRDNLTPIPGMASEIRLSPDGRIYSFPIRANAKWSNGRPVTPDDFAYSWRRILEARVNCEYSTMLYYIKNARPFNLQHLCTAILNSFPDKKKKDKLDAIKDALNDGARRRHATRLRELAAKEKDEEVATKLKEIAEQADKRPDLTWADVGVRVKGNVLEVELENPTAFAKDIFAFMTLMPVPKEVVEKHGDDWIKPKNIVTNGPFVLEKWQPHYAIVLRKNPHYYDAANVKLERVLCRVVEPGPTAFNYYERNLLEWMDKGVIPADFIESLRGRPDFKKFEVFATAFLRFNVTKPPFNDPRVRKAFAMVIDKKPIVEALKGGEVPTDRLVPPFPGYQEAQPKGVSYNPEEARKLLAEVYPDLSKFPKVEYLYRRSAKGADIFNLLREQIKKNLGITIEAKAQEWQIYLDSMNKLEYELAIGGWYGDYGDPNTFIDMWITGGGNNRTGWGKPEYDELVQQNLREQDWKKRYQIMARCEQIILEEECILVPLYVFVEYIMHKPKVKGLVTTTNPMARFLLRYVSVER